MKCFSPLTGWRGKGGKITLNRNEAFIDLGKETVPCGHCLGCRLNRSAMWAMRCLNEAQLHQENCFITLTFDEEHCPSDMSLDKTELRKFIKRLRKKYNHKKIKFYAAGEYGDQLLRPHYHICLFGHDFHDKELFKTKNNTNLYVSSELESLWTYGYSSVGDVTYDSAAYVARYIMKKITGDEAKNAYWRGDTETGECWQVEPEFNTMSNRGGGIGKEWYNRFKTDIYPSDDYHINGKKVKPPKYYDKLFQLDDPETFNEIKLKRRDIQLKNRKLNTESQLKKAERATRAKLGMKSHRGG